MNRELPDCTAWWGDEPLTMVRRMGSGFSGSRVFVVQRASGARFVLKHFPATTPAAHATWVHDLMRHLRAVGVETVPRIARVRAEYVPPDGIRWETLAVDSAGLLWELVEFMPGSPRAAPTMAEASEALASLARLHVAAATLPGSPPRSEPSPGVARRVAQATRMRAAPWRRLDPHAASSSHTAIRHRLEQAVEVFEASRGDTAIDRIAVTGPFPVVTQAVLRDAWSDHVLFADDGTVTGFIDFHAAACETPASDLARLLGSWHVPTEECRAPFLSRWQAAIRAYEAVRPLSTRERSLIPWLHATGVICGLDNWFRWLITDGRTFDDMSRVLERIDRFVGELPEALEVCRDAIPDRN